MQPRKNLDDLDVMVRRQNGRYFARIPQVGLYTTADSLPEAVTALEAKKKSLQEELGAADVLDQFNIVPIGYGAGASNAAVQTRMLPALTLFAAKCVIVVLLFLSAVTYAAHTIRQLNQDIRFGGASFWTAVADDINRAASPAADLPAAKKQALLDDIHVIVDRWRPFVREASRLFADQDSTKPSNP